MKNNCLETYEHPPKSKSQQEYCSFNNPTPHPKYFLMKFKELLDFSSHPHPSLNPYYACVTTSKKTCTRSKSHKNKLKKKFMNAFNLHLNYSCGGAMVGIDFESTM